MKAKVGTIAIVLGLSACSEPAPQPRAEDAANAAAAAAENASNAAVARADAADSAAKATPTISEADLARICRAAIAHMMGKDPAIMKVKSNSGGMVRIQYKRPDDGTVWKDDCRLEGDRVMWRAVDAFAGSGPGRWRNHPNDEVITYSLDGSNVTIHQRYSDGSNDSATFKIKA